MCVQACKWDLSVIKVQVHEGHWYAGAGARGLMWHHTSEHERVCLRAGVRVHSAIIACTCTLIIPYKSYPYQKDGSAIIACTAHKAQHLACAGVQ